jgi:predicted pyridoxine 5'-phosphate oxidase superfamily flavin-nucleotide-binding protein
MSGFHAGERAVQARAGVAERMAPMGSRVFRDFMLDQHRELFEKLPFMLLGGLDVQRRPWATLLAGPPGFARTPDARTLHFAAGLPEWDPLASTLAAGSQVGLLGIELATRRRNRANGVVVSRTADEVVVDVRQSFGNCPKYIVEREPRWSALPAPPAIERFAAALPADAAALIAAADTFFIASSSPVDVTGGGVDISHRGGPPGFVRVETSSVLAVPDYVGNSFFNTFGNLALDPRAGLLFLDFAAGGMLLLTGRAQVSWDGPEPTRRQLRFELEAGLLARGALPLRLAA